MTPVYALNAHASFACRHSGACCTAGWAIPVEAHKRNVIPVEWLTPGDDGACPEFDRSSRLCRIHRDHGETSLPESCRHFPRRALIDDRGTFVTLSHFCPTASRLLVESRTPLAVVEVVATEPGRTYEGLDARGAWPPLLRPDVLFDYASFNRWSAFLVEAVGDAHAPAAALTRVAAVAERLRAWHVAEGPLTEWTEEAVSRPPTDDELDDARRRFSHLSRVEQYERVCRTVPSGLSAPRVPDDITAAASAWLDEAWQADARPAARYLAAKAFAAWTPYQSHGLRTQIAELYAAEAVLYVEAARASVCRQSPLDQAGWIDAIRASDWLLMHLSDRDALMTWLRGAES